MNDPLEILIYNPERDGILPTVTDIMFQREAETAHLLRTKGTPVIVRWQKRIDPWFRRKKGVVTGTGQEDGAEVIYVRLEGNLHDNYFYPSELLLRKG